MHIFWDAIRNFVVLFGCPLHSPVLSCSFVILSTWLLHSIWRVPSHFFFFAPRYFDSFLSFIFCHAYLDSFHGIATAPFYVFFKLHFGHLDTVLGVIFPSFPRIACRCRLPGALYLLFSWPVGSLIWTLHLSSQGRTLPIWLFTLSTCSHLSLCLCLCLSLSILIKRLLLSIKDSVNFLISNTIPVSLL